MTGTVIAVSSGKGGVGKTTTSMNLASGIRMATHRSIAVVDLDLSMADDLDFLNPDFDPRSDTTLHDVLAGDAAVTDAVFDGPGGVHVVPSCPEIDGYAVSNPEGTNETIETLRGEYDVVFLDTPAGVNYESLLAMDLADFVVLVSGLRLASVRETENTKKLADRMVTPVLGVVFVKAGFDGAPDTDRIADYLGIGCLGQVPEDDTIPDPDGVGQSGFIRESAGSASTAYQHIADGLIRKLTTYATYPAD